MIRNILVAFLGTILGIVVGYFFIFRTPVRTILQIPGNQSMGFLPYWLLDKAQKDYSQYLNGIYYFGVTIGSDGKIVKYANPQEKEPDWYALESGKVDPFLQKAKQNHQTLSLVAFSGVNSAIADMINDPIKNADNLISDISPVMRQYGFTDLNLDVEYVGTASDEARMHFTQFLKELKQGLETHELGTLSIDISPSAFIQNYLVDPKAIESYIDKIIIMGYDYHYAGSYVTGPVAPLFGAASISEFDIQTAIDKALKIYPPHKIILGVPLYGYEWESIDDSLRSPVIPGTGLTASSQRVHKLIEECATCSARFDSVALEKYIVYRDIDTNSYHHIFYPDQKVMKDKVQFAEKYKLGGIALWALGYENQDMLEPLRDY